MARLNFILPRLSEVRSHLSFHGELSILTLLELFFNYFCSPYTAPYTCDTKIVYICLQTKLQLGFSQLLLELSAKRIWKRLCGRREKSLMTIRTEGAAIVNSVLHLICTAVESVLMAESCRVCLYVQKHGSSHESPVKILINFKIDDT